jgi:hypothetical protein
VEAAQEVGLLEVGLASEKKRLIYDLKTSLLTSKQIALLRDWERLLCLRNAI